MDKGSLSGGNFWSDYQSTPYMINSNNLDKYPLTAPFNISNPGNAPTATSPTQKPNSVVALWSFDNVDPDLVASDSTGNNPAVLGSVTGVYNYTPARVHGKFGKH